MTDLYVAESAMFLETKTGNILFYAETVGMAEEGYMNRFDLTLKELMNFYLEQ